MPAALLSSLVAFARFPLCLYVIVDVSGVAGCAGSVGVFDRGEAEAERAAKRTGCGATARSGASAANVQQDEEAEEEAQQRCVAASVFACCMLFLTCFTSLVGVVSRSEDWPSIFAAAI